MNQREIEMAETESQADVSAAPVEEAASHTDLSAGPRALSGGAAALPAEASGGALRLLARQAVARRKGLVGPLALLSLGLMAASAYYFNLGYNSLGPFTTPALLAVAGALSLGAALWLNRPNPALPAPAALAPAERLSAMDVRLVGLGGFALWLVAEANGGILHLPLLRGLGTHVQFALLCLGIGLVVAGLGGLRLRHLHLNGRTALPVLLITLFALGLRLWQIDTRAAFLVDENSFAVGIYQVRMNPLTPLLQPFSSIAAFPYIFPYFQADLLGLLGRGLVGLRATSAIMGALTVPALYLLANALFDRPTALLAALLLAVFPPHLQFSRIGLNNIADPLFGTLALGFLGRGLIYNRRRDYALGGAMLGLTHYFYEGGRVFFTPLAVVWLLGVAVLWRPRVSLRHVLVALAALVIVAAPVYYTLVGMGRPLLARMVDNQTSQKETYWQTLLNDPVKLENHIRFHIIPAFLVYTSYSDDTYFYRGETAMILPYLAPLFLLGLAWALWRLRAPGALLALLWVVGASLGNSLLVESIAYTRFVIVFPALALLLALALRYGLPLLWPPRWLRFTTRLWLAGRWFRLRLPPRDLARHQYVLMAALAAMIGLAEINYYFNQHLPVYGQQFRAAKALPDGYDAALRSVSFPPKTQIHLISAPIVNPIEARGLLTLMRDDLPLEAILSSDFTAERARDLPCGVDHAFFIQPDDAATLDKIRQYFPLRAPEYTANPDVGPGYGLALYYAPYLPDAEVRYGRHCP
jgi:hypothetical protein